jgi:hypothetical protein
MTERLDDERGMMGVLEPIVLLLIVVLAAVLVL